MLANALVLLCAVVRILPHPPNFAPVAATGVLAGRTLRPAVAIATVLAAMIVSDLVLGWLHGFAPFSAITPFIYGAFAAQVLVARALRRRRGGALIATALGAVLFFVVTNGAVWALGSMYPHDAAGLAACFVAALPFFGASLVGDLLWTVALVTAHRQLGRRLDARWTAPEALAGPAI